MTIEITLGGKKLLVSNIYRSPSPSPNLTAQEQLNEFYTLFGSLLEELASTGHDSYVMMDSNINLLKTDHGSPSLPFIETALENGFIQTVKKVTRICNEKISLIDHIFTNTKNTSITSGTIVSDISDHFITFICPPLSKQKIKKPPVVFRDMSLQQMTSFRAALGNLSWQNVLQSQNVDESYDTFWNDFKPLYELHFPEKRVPFNKNIHKINHFMSKGLLISRQKKNELFKTSVSKRDTESIESYKIYRNIYNRLIKASKKLYYEDHLSRNKKNPKKIWELLTEVSVGNKVTNKIERITVEGNSIEEPKQIAEHFNNFFSKIGREISESVLPTEKTATSYIPENNEIPTFSLGNTGPVHVTEFIKLFEPKKSKDFNGVSMQLLKFIATEISVPLSHIFNLSLDTGIFPNNLKLSRTVPIFKSGSPESCDNYRPISLLSSISKILEKMVATNFVQHLENNKLIYKHQYGFLKGLCTEHNLLHVTNTIAKALNDGKFCIGLFLDLKKAFDVCSHEILLEKLKRFGVRGKSLEWFKSYLSNRSQYVDINGHISSPKSIDISVLQGSILGPILFLCYINDLPEATTLLTFLFADDTCGLISGPILSELIDIMNTEINKLANWFRANKMAVNIGKTKFIIFHAKTKKIDLNGKNIVFNNNEIGKPFNPNLVTPLERVHNAHPDKECRAYKLLGVYLDEHFTFNHHVNFLCSKLTRSLFCIKRAKQFVNQNSLKLLYFALIHSNLLYCIGTLSAMSNANAKKIFQIQKKAIRTISNAKYNAHTNPLFFDLKILPYSKLQQQAKLNFMHGIEYNYGPPTFTETWPKNFQRNINYNLRNVDSYSIPRVNFEFLRNAPVFSFPLEWNKLDEIRQQRNKITFQFALKNKLMQELITEGNAN